MAVDPDTGSGSVRLIGMGSVSGLKSFLALVDWGGLGEGEGEEEIFSRREKSSGSASGVGRDTTRYGCLRGEAGDCRGEIDATGFVLGFDIATCCILSDLSLGRVDLNAQCVKTSTEG